MTVRELIDLLLLENPDKRVLVNCEHARYAGHEFTLRVRRDQSLMFVPDSLWDHDEYDDED